MNSDRIAKAKNEAETWRVVNDIIKPKVSTPITIKAESGNLTKEKEVAEAFNRYFVEKIENLKANIDPNSVQDPLIKFSEKMKDKNSFILLQSVIFIYCKLFFAIFWPATKSLVCEYPRKKTFSH